VVELARELGITKIIVPRETSALCALGAVNANLKWSNVASVATSIKSFATKDVNRALLDLKSEGRRFLEQLKLPESKRRYEVSVSARYPLQLSKSKALTLSVKPVSMTLSHKHGNRCRRPI